MKAVMLDVPQDLLDRRRRWGADKKDEVWDGVLHMVPPPRRTHQDFEVELLFWLRAFWAEPLGNRVHRGVGLTTADNLEDWVHDYRVPDLTLLTPDRFHIDHDVCFAGAPAVVVEIHSPGDEAYEKFGFYAEVGAPEYWILHRDTRRPELYALRGGEYELKAPDAPDAAGWLHSEATGVRMLHAEPDRVVLRRGDDGETERMLPE